MLLTPQEMESIRAASEWNESVNEYRVPPFYFQQKQVKFPRLP